LGPVRPGRRRGPGGGGAGGGRPGQRRGPGQGARPRGPRQAERPRTNEEGTSAEGRTQPTVEPQVEETPKPVADAPDTTTPKQQVEDAAKPEQSGTPPAEKPKRSPRKPKES